MEMQITAAEVQWWTERHETYRRLTRPWVRRLFRFTAKRMAEKQDKDLAEIILSGTGP